MLVGRYNKTQYVNNIRLYTSQSATCTQVLIKSLISVKPMDGKLSVNNELDATSV